MGNEVATTGNTLPAHLQNTGTDSGYINDDGSLLTAPRIKLIQKSSKEFDEGLSKQGEFFYSPAQEASSTLIFTPLRGSFEFIAFDDSGNITFQSESEAEARQELGEDYWKAKQINIVMLPHAKMIPAIYSFKGTGYKTGTKLYQLCKVANPNCMFSRAYKLTSEEHQGAGGKYYTPLVSLAGEIEGYSDKNSWLTETGFEVAKTIAEQL
jgi:hypothetical protein